MRRRSAMLRALLVCGLAVLVPSCAGTQDRTTAVPRTVPKQAAPDVEARKHLAAGSYQQAIDDYAAELRRRPQDRELLRRYVDSLAEINALADRDLENEAYAAAGKGYLILLTNFPRFSAFAPTLAFDQGRLKERLARCRDALSTRGFKEYRQGDLDAAIATWQSLLAIDPGNEQIKAILDTARLQRSNLREGASSR